MGIRHYRPQQQQLLLLQEFRDLNNNRYECTEDEKLADAASYAPNNRCVCAHSPDGSTFLREMTSWPPY